MIPELMVQFIFVFVLDVTEGMVDGTDSRDVHQDFRLLEICAPKISKRNNLSIFVSKPLHYTFVTGVVCSIGKRKGLRLGETRTGWNIALHCMAVPGVYAGGFEVAAGRIEIVNDMELAHVREAVHGRQDGDGLTRNKVKDVIKIQGAV